MTEARITDIITLTDEQTIKRFRMTKQPLFLGCRFFEDAPKNETSIEMLTRILRNRTTDPTEITIIRPNGAPDDWWREATDTIYTIANAQIMIGYRDADDQQKIKVVIVQ